MNDSLVLATTSDGKEVTLRQCVEFVKQENKQALSGFIYDRLYGRYLKPFDYPSNDYKKKYKNGFALMANCCLLIETYVSFIEKKYRDTTRQSREVFGYFFTFEKRFSEFSEGGINAKGQIAGAKEGGIPNDFYFNVRCGILHNGETRNGWTITRKQNKPLFNAKTKEVNATKFANELKLVLRDYARKLKKNDFDSSDIWDNFKKRLNDLMAKS
jgi:hypothetical protein